MFFDPRLGGAGRSVRKTWHKTGRSLQEIWTGSDADAWHGSGYTGDGSNVADETDEEMGSEENNANTWADGEDVEDGESQARFWMHSSQSWSSSTWPDRYTVDTTSTLVPSGESSLYSPSSWSNAASTSAPLVDTENGSTTAVDAYFQTSVTEYPDMPSISSTTRNPWITATSIEELPSGQTLVPFYTFGGEASATSSTQPTSHSTRTTTLSISSGAISASFSADFNSAPGTTNTVAAIPHVVHVDGLSAAQKAGTIAGTIIGVAIIGMLIALSVFAYTRGGGMRGAILRSLSRSSVDRKGTDANADKAPRDLEDATTSTGQKGDWEDVDIRRDDADGSEKEKFSHRPPELHFDPALPLPPIVLIPLFFLNDLTSDLQVIYSDASEKIRALFKNEVQLANRVGLW